MGDDETDLRRRRLAKALELAEGQAGVISRHQLYAIGVTRAQVKANLKARRWQRVWSQSVCVTTGPLTDDARRWAAVLEAGPRAFLDGATALVAGGLEHFTEASTRVTVPRGAKIRRAKGLDIRQTRRWDADDLAPSGVPRSRPEVAAVRAALWARTDREAALVVTMTVQQGLTTAQRLGQEMLRIRRAPRRAFLHAVVLDLLGGVRSLGELDFAREARRRGLPEPTRQAIRKGRDGRYYLDVCWEEWGVVVEIDGIQHTWASAQVADALRQNDVTLDNATVLRLPLLGLRVAPDAFFDQILEALRSNGCPLKHRRTA